MIPWALFVIVALGVGGVWFVHLVIGMRHTIAKVDKLEKESAELRGIIEDWMVGAVDQADVRALFRRTFSDARERAARGPRP